MGEQLTYSTARLAMLLYASALGWMLAKPGRSQTARWFWSMGCSVFLLHVMCAFHFVHHWSHAEAYAATARQTAAIAGLDWGGGLWFNYLFTLVWLGDAGWWWLAPDHHQKRPRAVTWIVHGYMGFIAFNATVVFGTGLTRWLGATACLLLLWLCWTRRGR